LRDRLRHLSLGTIRPTQAVADAVQAAAKSGVIVIAAAGNTVRSEPLFYPAVRESVLSVAGTTMSDQKAPFGSELHQQLRQ
jgi:subtilisin family serine protease